MREMKTSFVLLLGIVCVPAVSAIQDNVFEFGQFRLLEENGQSVLKPSGKVGRSDQVLMQKSKRSTDDIDEHAEEEDFPWNLYLSMSMSMKYPSPWLSEAPVVPTTSAPTVSPTLSPTVSPTLSPSNSNQRGPILISAAPTTSSPPSNTPTISPAPSTSYQPSSAPTISNAPTASVPPSGAPTITPGPSPIPSLTGAPTPIFFQEQVVFTCTGNGVNVIEPPFEVVTFIDIKVVYLVETLIFLSEFSDAFEAKILESAVIGAMQCDTGGPLFGPGGDPPSVAMFTAPTGESCTPVSENTICTVLETEFSFVVEEDLDPDVAAVLAYAFIREEMNSGAFVAEIPELDRVEYIRPTLPDLPSIIAPPNDDGLGLPQGSITVSPWTVGAVLAMCFGGVMALWVWVRNRKTRHGRHVQLLEDMSFASPLAASA